MYSLMQAFILVLINLGLVRHWVAIEKPPNEDKTHNSGNGHHHDNKQQAPI